MQIALEKSGLKPTNANILANLIAHLAIPQSLEKFKLGSEKFSINIGKRVLDSELKEQGAIPVYSANVLKPFGFINKELLSDYTKDSVLWGIDGDWLVGFMPENTPFYPTDHCGVLRVKDENIKAKIVKFALEEVGKKEGFCRSLRASTQRISALSIALPPLESQEKIVKIIENIESKITHLDSALESLSKEKAEILHKALNDETTTPL